LANHTLMRIGLKLTRGQWGTWAGGRPPQNVGRLTQVVLTD